MPNQLKRALNMVAARPARAASLRISTITKLRKRLADFQEVLLVLARCSAARIDVSHFP